MGLEQTQNAHQVDKFVGSIQDQFKALEDRVAQLEADEGSVGDVLFSSGVEVVINGHTTETAIASGTLKGGKLGTTNWVLFRVYIQITNVTGVLNTTFRIKYGATTLATCTFTVPATSERLGYIDFVLRADGATNAQEGLLVSVMIPTGGTLQTAVGVSNDGTSAIDSTVDQTIAITVQHASVDAGLTTESHGHVCYGNY